MANRENERAPKERFTAHIPVDLIDQVRNAIYWTPAFETLAAVTERGLRREVKALERKYNGGEPFPKRKANLKGGRPAGS